jgi:cytosine/adenosine deaminase-related metal-dependent hydrolase
MFSANQVIFHGSKVLLPDHDELTEASIVVDADKGTILSVTEGPLSGINGDVEVIDAGDNVILPGLVE